jgi:uncharacterized membrane protein
VNADQSSGIRLTRAVEEAERHTGCEVIVVGFACADGYLDVAFRNAFVVALVALGLVLMVPVDIHEVLVFPIVAGASLAAFWISHLPGVARVTSTRKRRGAAIRTAMAEAFLKQGVSRTRDRVGVLIAFFELERDAAVLFDTGLQARIPGDVETRAACITAIGARLGAWVPRGTDDVDELPNTPKTGGAR